MTGEAHIRVNLIVPQEEATMKYLLASALALAHSAAALVFTTTPSLTFCHSTTVRWSGGTPPYDLTTTGGTYQLNALGLTEPYYSDDYWGPVGELGIDSYRFLLDSQELGERITFHVKDSTGATADSGRSRLTFGFVSTAQQPMQAQPLSRRILRLVHKPSVGFPGRGRYAGSLSRKER